jgi:flavin reductase (DIM6/NTAB) family NADH-FMN oxidoreductase RutF
MSFVDSSDFQAGMRHLVGAVCIVTTWHDGSPWGLTATAVCSLSADPPTLLVCVNRSAEAHRHILASRLIGVNVLAAHHQPLAELFSSRSIAQGSARFSDDTWQRADKGAPRLADCLAHFDGSVISTLDCKTHTAFVCAITSVVPAELSDADPLIYFRRAYRQIIA